ncbi:MAG: hypothetical protein QG657_2585 [Acidobacteriota bacterium]|nr:hypothetical protein [Acidobacteriota bacterium]
MAMLSNWFFNEKQPMLVLEAIGGMGKSALSWAWLHQEIIEKAVKVEGVFWWSFYDEPFESFLTHLYCYVTGEEKPQAIDQGNLLAALNQRRFLLVLDGIERALRGYAGMEAMYIQEKKFEGNTQVETEWDKRQREPVHPLSGRFLQALCAGNTKTLMTTRLTSVSVEGVRGVKHVFLTGLSAEDTVNFFRSEGINGTRAEMEQAGRVYDFHPLMLKLLASAIKRSRAKDIKEAFSLNIIDQKEPHKILERSVQLLSEEERQVVTRVAVFRAVFTFDAAKALAEEVEEKQLWEVLRELRSLGFVFYNESRDCFDFHPILRSYLYGQLTSSGGTGVHNLAAQYFEALPKPGKVVSLEDLAPVIELYHHMLKAGKYDEAWVLYRDRIWISVYYQLAAYQLQIELLKPLFPGWEHGDRLPRLEKEADQAWTLNALANTYALSGQSAEVVQLYLLKSKLSEKSDAGKVNLAIGLGNAAYSQILIGQISAAAGHLQKRIALGQERYDKLEEAIGHADLGRIMAFHGKAKGDNLCAEEELNKAFKLFEKDNNVQSLSVVSAYRSLSALLQARLAAVLPGIDKRSPELIREALHQARQALAFAEKDAETDSPVPRDFVQAYWLLAEALIQCCVLPNKVKIEHFDIPFYDEYFQQVVETVTVTDSAKSLLSAAARCLHEALRRCRKTNMVEFEPDILLALARLDFAQNNPPDESLLKEAREIALRSGYRLKLADLHLFCGQTLLQSKTANTLLGLTATEHLQKT